MKKFLLGVLGTVIAGIFVALFTLYSKLPPAEPVALIRHKWPATNCGKPRSNASHRNF